MALKPEQSYRSRLCRKAESRAKRTAKRASTRIARRAAKRDPENAPTRRIVRGWID